MEYYIIASLGGLFLGWFVQYLRTQNIRLNYELLKEKYNLCKVVRSWNLN